MSDSVERRRRAEITLAATAAVAQLPFGFLLLDVRAVRQQHFEQIDRRRRRINRPAKAKNREPRQQTRVVDMGVRQKHEIDVASVESEIQRTQVFRPRVGAALKHAAVDEKAGVFRFHQRA